MQKTTMRHDFIKPALLQRRSHGFTLVEMIIVIIIVGIMAVAVMPRFSDQSMFESRGFHDETQALLRYAQKTAVAQRRVVCVALNNNGVALTIDTDTPADGVCNSSPTLPNKPRGGSGLVASVTRFEFTPFGSTNQSANINISIAGSSDIRVDAVTGYIYD
jgi:MSHA pilin protein MshC